MKLLAALAAAALASACAAPGGPAPDPGPLKEVVRDPARLHSYFVEMIRRDEPAAAHKVIAAGVLPYEAFYLGLHNTQAPDLTRRVLLGFRQAAVKVSADGDSATLRWHNEEFGICRDYRAASQVVAGRKIWGLVLSRADLEELVPAALAWFRRQRDAADGRFHAYPPDWTYASVGASCDCPRSRN